jgi:phosphoribosylformylglycinamidine synthase
MALQPPLHRIEVGTRFEDTVAEGLAEALRREAPGLRGVRRVEVLTIAAALDPGELAAFAGLLGHPVSRPASVDAPLLREGFDWAVEVGFLPGVTDNVARTAGKMLADGLGRPLRPEESLHSSRLLLLEGPLGPADREAVSRALANPLVERVEWKSAAEYARDTGMDRIAPRVTLVPHPEADFVDLELEPEELARLGREGIPERPGARGPGLPRRGPLALDLEALAAIRDHFRRLGRRPTDVELESLAQNWSEHCRHLIFNSPIDDIDEGLFRRFIRGATEKIRAERGADDPCVSVFTDNAGAVAFDEDWLITDKVETHNSPSALDPFGGALTGILGVNRDALGFGLGALPILNRYGFCLPLPSDRRELYRAPGCKGPVLPPELLAEGIFKGVEVGGNCCGIPTPQGFWLFHEGYRAKPLVFVGTLGLIPRRGGGRELWRKRARPGDRIVMAGGRVGLDGIHGATFSSEALASGSPATAVQIGDPIGQKLLLDALVHEARDRGLYSSLTDDGAGGLSCSVPEMARESGGCRVDLDRVPLKYPGMAPWQIWISESQERMTLAVPPEHVEELISVFARRDVEATDIGEFTDDGRCVVISRGQVVLDLDLRFLLDGWPVQRLKTQAPGPGGSSGPSPGGDIGARSSPAAPFPQAPAPSATDAGKGSEMNAAGAAVRQALASISGRGGEIEPRARLLELLGSPNFASREELALRFDHEVQGTSVLKPLVGPGRVDADATAIRPLPGSWRGVAVSQGLCPEWTERDPYRMACWAVDEAVRRLVAVGARLRDIVLLDNFCWCSPHEPERLWQLKEACRGCHDTAVAYGTPFISGKDSMHNDFRGYDAQGRPVKLSIPPTLLISSLAVVPEVRKLVTLEPKAPGDTVLLLGLSGKEPGGSAWSGLQGRGAGQVPPLDTELAVRLYEAHAEAADRGLLASSIALGHGGLAYAAARMALGSGLGLRLNLDRPYLSGTCTMDVPRNALLWVEAPARLLVTCGPDEAEDELARLLQQTGVPFVWLGRVTQEPRLHFHAEGFQPILSLALDELDAAYRADWRDAP